MKFDPKAKRYEFKLFLEGIETPFLNLNLSTNPELTFHVSIPPFFEGLQLEANTSAIIIFREKKIESQWKMLCSGIYYGYGYSKSPESRNLMLMFSDVKWFYDITRLFDYLKIKNSTFVNYEVAFFGDARYADSPQETEIPGDINFAVISQFLNLLESGDKPIKEMIDWLLDNAKEANEFVKVHFGGHKLSSNRFKFVENNKTPSIFKGAVLGKIFSKIFDETSNQTTLTELIWGLMQVIQYEITPVLGSLSTAFESWIIKPKIELVAPPNCNVVFPYEFISFNTSVNYHNQPTRFHFVDTLTTSKSEAKMFGFYAPAELKKAFNSENDGTPALVTDEEKIKGIIPKQMSMPYDSLIGMGFSEGNDYLDLVDIKGAYADYFYRVSKYSSTPLVIETIFKPDLLPGFPILLLDGEMMFIGLLDSINMSADNETGYAQCSLTVSHVRPINVETPLLAGWYEEEQFKPDAIGAEIYQKIHPSIKAFYDDLTKAPPVINGMVSFEKSAREILRQYIENPNKKDFQKEFFERKLPVFWDEENENADSIAKTLGVSWDKENKELVPNSENSILSMKFSDGFSVSEKRREKVFALRERFNNHGRKFIKEEE